MARPNLRRRRPLVAGVRHRRWVPAVIAVTLALALFVAGPLRAQPAAADSTSSTSTTSPPTTAPPTTAAPAPPAPPPAPVPAPAPTVPKPPTPTTAAPGVPHVPTGGGQAPSTPGPANDTTLPVVAAVQADLDQMQAIANVGQARQAVSTAKANQASSQAALATAQAAQAAAESGVAAARATLAQSVGKLSSIAVAAYTGMAYGTPAAAPANLPGTAPGGIPGVGATQSDADELMNLVTQQIKERVKAAQAQVAAATATLDQAAASVQRAQTTVQQAAAAVTAAQTTLTQTLRGATVSGAAFAHQQAAGTSPAATPTTKPGTGGQSSGTDTGPDGSPTILGPPIVSAAELYGWYNSTHHVANTTVPIGQLAADYIAASKTTGVRGDLAFAQSIIETGYFSFPAGGQLVSANNNFAGIGACDSCAHGWSFPDAMTGVTAQEQLLEAYASTTKVATPLVGPVGIGGCCQTWMALAGRWATDRQYGISIMTVYKQILDYAIPEALVQAGLAPAGSAPPLPALPAGPTTSPLPAALPAVAPPTTTAQAPTLAPPGT